MKPSGIHCIVLHKIYKIRHVDQITHMIMKRIVYEGVISMARSIFQS